MYIILSEINPAIPDDDPHFELLHCPTSANMADSPQKPKRKKKTRKQPHKDGEDGNAVFVRGLPASATGDQLESFFSSVGPIRRTFVVTDTTPLRKCTGVGFVHFALREDAKKAIDFMQGASFTGRKLRLDFARPRERGAESGGASTGDGGLRARAHTGSRPPPVPVKGALAGSLGMRTVVVKTRAAGTALEEADVLARLGDLDAVGFESIMVGAGGDDARAVFRSWPKAGLAAAKIHGEKYDACVDALRGGKKCRLIVRNLPFTVLNSEFRKVFMDIGPVREISLPSPKDEDGKDRGEGAKGEEGAEVPVKCRGFGFVEYFLAADANRAIAKVNGTKIGGRIVAVDLAIGKAAFLLKSAEEAEDVEEETIEKDVESVAKIAPAEAGAAKNAKVEEAQAPKPEPKQGKSTTEEMERTVFIRNLLYESSASDLWQAIQERFGPVEQAVIVKDPMTGRPRGTAFVRFANPEHVTAAVDENAGVTLQGRTLLIVRAQVRERARELVLDGSQKKEKNDPRNMRLAWIGTIKPDTPEARGMTEGDFAKRVKAEQEKRAKLSSNPNAFVSETRLSVRNLPRFVDEKFLKQMFLAALRPVKGGDGGKTVGKSRGFPKVTHTKVLRDPTRKDRSKGYGFIQFQEHRHALQVLHKLNNNPNALKITLDANPKALALDDEKRASYRKQWGAVRRLIVEFSVEDRRQVAIIDRIKEKGRAMKAAAAGEQTDEATKGGGSRKRKASPSVAGRKKHKTADKAKSVDASDGGKPKTQRKEKTHSKQHEKPRGGSKAPVSVGDKGGSKKTGKKRREPGSSELRDTKAESRRSKKKKKSQQDEDKKFDDMVAKYKSKISRTEGKAW